MDERRLGGAAFEGTFWNVMRSLERGTEWEGDAFGMSL